MSDTGVMPSASLVLIYSKLQRARGSNGTDSSDNATLGEGAFATVYRAWDRRSRQWVAVKMYTSSAADAAADDDRQKLALCRERWWQVKNEYQILSTLEPHRHPNIVPLLHIVQQPTGTIKAFVMPVYDCTLHDWQQSFGGTSSGQRRPPPMPLRREVQSVGRQLLSALALLRRCNIVHGDLKPENIMIMSSTTAKADEDLPIVIVDFGSSLQQPKPTTPQQRQRRRRRQPAYMQTRWYRSPELALGLPFDTGIDMWSLACVLWEMATAGRPLLPADSDVHLIDMMCNMMGTPDQQLLLQQPPQQNQRGGCCVEAWQRLLERCRPATPTPASQAATAAAIAAASTAAASAKAITERRGKWLGERLWETVSGTRNNIKSSSSSSDDDDVADLKPPQPPTIEIDLEMQQQQALAKATDIDLEMQQQPAKAKAKTTEIDLEMQQQHPTTKAKAKTTDIDLEMQQQQPAAATATAMATTATATITTTANEIDLEMQQPAAAATKVKEEMVASGWTALQCRVFCTILLQIALVWKGDDRERPRGYPQEERAAAAAATTAAAAEEEVEKDDAPLLYSWCHGLVEQITL